MPSLWEARVAMEVSKANLGLALAQNFKKGCRRARADLLYEEPQAERYAGLSPRAGASGPPAGYRRPDPLGGRRVVGMATRQGSRPPLPRYTRVKAVCGLYFELHLYNMGFWGASLSQHSQLGALVSKLNFLSALLARSNVGALGAHPESASSSTTTRKRYVCGALLSPPELLEAS